MRCAYSGRKPIAGLRTERMANSVVRRSLVSWYFTGVFTLYQLPPAAIVLSTYSPELAIISYMIKVCLFMKAAWMIPSSSEAIYNWNNHNTWLCYGEKRYLFPAIHNYPWLHGYDGGKRFQCNPSIGAIGRDQEAVYAFFFWASMAINSLLIIFCCRMIIAIKRASVGSLLEAASNAGAYSFISDSILANKSRLSLRPLQAEPLSPVGTGTIDAAGCPNCGKAPEEGMSFCRKCGTKLDD